MNSRLYDKLCRILEEMEAKEKLTASDLQVIDWATHAKKSILAIEEMEGGSYEEGGYGEGSYNARRGGSSRRRRRDSMGRFREGSGGSYGNTYGGSYGRRTYRDGGREEFTAELRELMESAPDEQSKMNIQRMLRDLEE